MMTKPTRSLNAATSIRSVMVWDIGIRLFHWSLVLAVLVAALTGFFGSPGTTSLHLFAGTLIAVLLLFRIIWGLVGSTYARFRNFLFRPSQMIARFRELKAGQHNRYLGHNPLGAAMVIALLLVLLTIVSTGVVVLGGTLKQGPLAFMTPYAVGSIVKEVHQIFAFGLIGMIGLHLAGVIYETLIGREKLIHAMISGKKIEEPHIDHPATVRTHVVIGLTSFIAISAFGFGLITTLSAKPGLGVPLTALDSTYEKECGACHYAYHPSMGTVALWTGILEGLPNHFGEDASLPDATKTQILHYLLDNSAEHWDTRISKVLAKPNPDDPLRFTATRFWTRMHSELPEALFKMKPIGFKGNCAACHQDAKRGFFAPQSIDIPQGDKL